MSETLAALDYLVRMANGHNYADAMNIMEAEHEIRAALLAATAPAPDEACVHCGTVSALVNCPTHAAPTPDEVGQGIIPCGHDYCPDCS